jgi:hypothetical protein
MSNLEPLRNALTKRAQEKKVNPSAAKGAVAGATVGAITDKYKAEDALRDAIRVARKSKVDEGSIEGLVGATMVNHVAPKPEADDSAKEAPVAMGSHGLGNTLAEKASAAKEMLKKAIGKCPSSMKMKGKKKAY